MADKKKETRPTTVEVEVEFAGTDDELRTLWIVYESDFLRYVEEFEDDGGAPGEWHLASRTTLLDGDPVQEEDFRDQGFMTEITFTGWLLELVTKANDNPKEA